MYVLASQRTQAEYPLRGTHEKLRSKNWAWSRAGPGPARTSYLHDDHVSDFVYVHLMQDFTLAETLLAKYAWEKVLAQANRTVKHYHADNGRFADKGFVDAANAQDQKLTFCGVGAHHQNGIIENKNKILTQGARTLLLHGMRMWPQMIDHLFWPFAFKAMADCLNNLQINLSGDTPTSI